MKRRLRVLHLRNSDVLGGPERLLLDQAALAASDVAPVLASFGRRGAPHALLAAARAQGTPTRLVVQSSSYDPRLRRRVRQLIAEVDPHVLVSHDYKANLLARLAGGARPRVAVVHGFTGEGRKVRFFEAVDRRVLRGMDRVVVVSPALRERLVATGVLAERVRLVANGIRGHAVRAAAALAREDLRAAWGAGEETLVCLALGRLSPEKGHDVLLDAFGGVDPSLPLHLVLVGDGGSRPDLERRAAALPIADRVRFVGWRDDPWACLGAADVFVLPSRTEGVPIALLEAMACELPVVATRVGGVPEVLADGDCGRLVGAEDVGALRQAIEELAVDVALRHRMGAAARTRVDAGYGAEAQARALEAIYRDAARWAPASPQPDASNLK